MNDCLEKCLTANLVENRVFNDIKTLMIPKSK